jgi:hypothetical protein
LPNDKYFFALTTFFFNYDAIKVQFQEHGSIHFRKQICYTHQMVGILRGYLVVLNMHLECRIDALGMQDIVHEFKVPRYCFSPSLTHFVSLLFGFPKLNALGQSPPQLDGKPCTILDFPLIVPFDLPRHLLGDQKQPKILLYHGE